MTIRRTVTLAVAAATLAGAGLFAPTSAANAGYYSPGNGYYGKPYYPPVYYKPPHCFWEKYRYRGPYGWAWGKRWVCK